MVCTDIYFAPVFSSDKKLMGLSFFFFFFTENVTNDDTLSIIPLLIFIAYIQKCKNKKQHMNGCLQLLYFPLKNNHSITILLGSTLDIINSDKRLHALMFVFDFCVPVQQNLQH